MSMNMLTCIAPQSREPPYNVKVAIKATKTLNRVTQVPNQRR